MFDKRFGLIHDFLRNKKKPVLWIVVLLTAAAGIGLPFYQFEGNIDLMLPNDRDIHRSINFLRDSKLSDKVIISLVLTSPDKTRKDLFNAADQLAASLPPSLFSKVITGISALNVMDALSVINYAPQMLGEKDLSFIDSRINAAGISEKLQGIYRQSLKPESIFMTSMSRTDPLGIRLLLLDKLRALPASMGYDVSIEDGHFVSRDGRHALLIIQTPVAMTDSPGCKKIVTALQEQTGRLPEYISADVIGGHLHTFSNEKVIKRDILVASTLVSVAFLLLFIAVFRDMRVILVFIAPLAAVILSIGLSYIILGKISYLVIGFGTAIAGISTDYGLHVYIAARKGAGASQRVSLAKLLFVDAATTIFGFSALYFSHIQGYHQLASFSILCTIFSLALALFILPLLLSIKKDKVLNPPEEKKLESLYLHKRLIVGSWALLTLAALFFSFNIKFDSEVTRLDGSEPEVLRAEKNFHDTWGGKSSQAIFVVTDKNHEAALETNDRIFQEATQAIGAENFSSIAAFWSSEKTRKKNIENWNRFWKGERETKLKRLIREESFKYQFSEQAFSPFFDNLYNGTTGNNNSDEFLSRLKERFVQEKQDGYQILSFFPDKKEHVDAMAALSAHYPGTFLVSGKAMSRAISDFTAKEFKFLVPVALAFNIGITFWFFKNLKETTIALVPLITGMTWLMGLMSLLNLPLNVVSILAAIVTSGVIVDYGIGMTYECQYDLKIGTVIAVSLSAVTTIIGAGVLLFAKHPALFSTAAAMVICLLAGYLSSITVVPALCSIFLKPRIQEQAA
ncbi:MAG: exporter-like protein [Nitrospirae bacterium]|nr:MAG: exporter-like protein [Nitrospirota bacterium]